MTEVLQEIHVACFDPEATKAMGQAFDRACQRLNWAARPSILNEGIAKQIIEIAGMGERDPDRMCNQVLRALGLNR